MVDLIPNGRNIMVTDDNKLEYVQRITHHRMTHSIRGQIEAFLEGDARKRKKHPTARLLCVSGVAIASSFCAVFKNVGERGAGAGL